MAANSSFENCRGSGSLTDLASSFGLNVVDCILDFGDLFVISSDDLLQQ